MPKRKEKLDDAKLMDEQKLLQVMIASDGWVVAKQKLNEKLATLDSISAMPDNVPPQTYYENAKIREGTISIILDWLRDVEGTAAQAENTKEEIQKIRKEDIVRRY